MNKILTKTEVQLTKDSAHKTAYHYSSTTTTPGTAIQLYIDYMYMVKISPQFQLFT